MGLILGAFHISGQSSSESSPSSKPYQGTGSSKPGVGFGGRSAESQVLGTAAAPAVEGGSNTEAIAPSGSGASRPGEPSVQTTRPQELRRKRRHQEDSVSNPQLDEFDDYIQGLLSNHATTVEDLIEEIRLYEDAKRAECCNCKETQEVFDPETCDGGCASPFVCCPSGPACEPGKSTEQAQEDLPDIEQTIAGWMTSLGDFPWR